MHGLVGSPRVLAVPLLVLVALVGSGGALAGAPATSPPPFRLWSAPELFVITRETPWIDRPTLELHRRPIDPSAQELCRTSLFQGGAQDCFVPYQDCSLNLQLSRAGGGLTVNVRGAEGADCPSDLPAAWKLTGELTVVQLVRADFVARMRSLDLRMQVGEHGRSRPAAELIRPLPDAELLRLYDAVTPFLSGRAHQPPTPGSLMDVSTTEVAILVDRCKTADNAGCIRGYLETRYPKPRRSGGKASDPTPTDLGDEPPVPASKFAVPKGLTPQIAGVWSSASIYLHAILTVSARLEGEQLHLTFQFQTLATGGGLREPASFPSVVCSGAFVSQGWSKLACDDEERKVKVKLQGDRLVVRPLAPRWSYIDDPRLWLEETFFRVDPLALQAAFLRRPVHAIGADVYPQNIEADLADTLVGWLEGPLPQKVRAFLRARKEIPETLSATRALDLLSFTVANLMKRCPTGDPGRNACIERELPGAIHDAYRAVSDAQVPKDGDP